MEESYTLLHSIGYVSRVYAHLQSFLWICLFCTAWQGYESKTQVTIWISTPSQFFRNTNSLVIDRKWFKTSTLGNRIQRNIEFVYDRGTALFLPLRNQNPVMQLWPYIFTCKNLHHKSHPVIKNSTGMVFSYSENCNSLRDSLLLSWSKKKWTIDQYSWQQDCTNIPTMTFWR